ncbi:MAG: 4Fe-4S dicluster domain-containing protein [Ruminococcaceae bacterium]|nr:4Fe-4S dicluster domain-containing protein [Oscillospiraceae bacterium]
MLYNAFKGKQLSALGLGCMRFPTLPDKSVDFEKTKEIIDFAFKNGINYYDTAWGYHYGQSESVLGEILSSYDRNDYYLASKFPGYDLENFGKQKEIFEKQLEKCKTDYFDFYLFHCVSESNIEAYLDDEKYGVYSFLTEQKKLGRIKHLGLSCHCSIDTLKRFFDAYGNDIEFCQIQLNWLDWEYQDAKAKVDFLNSINVPVWVMEPVRGGRLFNLAPVFDKVLKDACPDRTTAEWAFRFIQTVPGVCVTLSGMSNLEQLKENIGLFSEKKPLTAEETELLFDLGRKMTAKNPLPCTGCKYCTEYCPMELDIPYIIELYNNYKFTTGGYIAPKETSLMEENKKPSACIGCQACEAVCPQSIKISEMMADFTTRLKP